MGHVALREVTYPTKQESRKIIDSKGPETVGGMGQFQQEYTP